MYCVFIYMMGSPLLCMSVMEQRLFPTLKWLWILNSYSNYCHFIIQAANIHSLFFLFCQVNSCWYKCDSKCGVGFWHYGCMLGDLESLSPWRTPLAFQSGLYSDVNGQHICPYLLEAPPCFHLPGSNVNLCFCTQSSSSIMRLLICLSQEGHGEERLYPIHLCLPRAPWVGGRVP